MEKSEKCKYSFDSVYLQSAIPFYATGHTNPHQATPTHTRPHQPTPGYTNPHQAKSTHISPHQATHTHFILTPFKSHKPTIT